MVTLGLVIAAISFVLGLLRFVSMVGPNITMASGHGGEGLLGLCIGGVVVGIVMAIVGAVS